MAELETIGQRIKRLRKDRELTADEAREAWDDLLNPEYGPQAGRDYYHRELYESKHFERVFVDYESLPEKTKINPLCQEFWNATIRRIIKDRNNIQQIN